MAETLQQYPETVVGEDGTEYEARACGGTAGDGLWHGWIEFVPVSGGDPIRSPRETTQPNRADTAYWASGLSHVYLEGALRRARNKPITVPVTVLPPPAFSEPAPSVVTAATPAASILNPFSVYEKGEALLRRELGALSSWHLINIVLDYELSAVRVETLNRMTAAALIELIVTCVRNFTREHSNPGRSSARTMRLT